MTPGGMTAYRSRNPSTTGATLTRGGGIGANNHLSAAVSNAAVANRDQSRVQVSFTDQAILIICDV